VYRTTAVLVVACCLAVGVLAGASAGVGGVDTGDVVFQEEAIDPDDVLITVEIDADGDAVWSIEYRTRLVTDDNETAFEAFRSDLEANPEAYTDRFRGRMETTVADADSATGREMSVSNVSVTAERREIPQEYGVVVYRFRWNGFADVEDGRITAGDAIGGLFLDEQSSLILSWPESHELAEASPDPTERRDGAVVWVGPTDFTAGEPRIAAERGSVVDAVPSWLPLLVGALLLVGVLAAYIRRDRDATSDADGTAATPDADGSAATPERAESAAATAADAEPGDAENANDGEAEDEAAPPADEELLSNEEQVLRLIEREGGRMKQKRVAEELDWTDAKTSQVTTGLRDEGELDGFRLGRENVLSLPDDDEDD
jgi:hypothetical protein